MMLEELQRRNYSAETIRCYIRTVEEFSRRFRCSPDRLGPQQIREYQAELFHKRNLSPGTVTQRLAVLRFFYIKTLQRSWSIAETPYPKKAVHLPTILSQEEVARLIDAASTLYHRTLLMTLYATGVRRAELAHLRISDVDSRRMVIHVQGGKGRKDRDVVFTLPQRLASLALQNKKVIYDLLFRASAETLLEVARNPQHLGAEIGFFSVLHTWNQKLGLHPHVHC